MLSWFFLYFGGSCDCVRISAACHAGERHMHQALCCHFTPVTGVFSLLSPLCCHRGSGSPECSPETFFCQYRLNSQSSLFPTDHWGSSSASGLLAVFSPPVSPFFSDILHATQLTVGLLPILLCHKPSDALTPTHTHSTEEQSGRGAAQPKVNQILFVLLKHFLSTSNVQITVQKPPEVGGGLGTITASNCPILQQSPQAQGGEVTCTKPPSRGEASLEPDIAPQTQDLFFVSGGCSASCFLLGHPSVLLGSTQVLAPVRQGPGKVLDRGVLR